MAVGFLIEADLRVCLLRHIRGCCAHLRFVPRDLLSPLENVAFCYKRVTHGAAGLMKMPPADHYLFNKGLCVHSGVEATCFVPDTVYSLPLYILFLTEARPQPPS